MPRVAQSVARAVPLLVAALASARAAAESPRSRPGASSGSFSDSAPIEPLPSAPPPLAPAAPSDVADAPPAAKRSTSGLVWRTLVPGRGTQHPGPSDQVKIAFTGWTPGGRTFDSSVPNGEPSTFDLPEVIPGWSEALTSMAKGEQRRLWVPSRLAYGEGPTRHGWPTGPLVFDVELVDFARRPEPVTAPDDVRAAPKDARRTGSGLAYRILRHGQGKAHPTAQSTVEVHYSGWTTNGVLFDSSVMRGQPTTFPLDGVIKGWTEGLQLMVVGDKARFWIPADLAYGDRPASPGTPSGTLVFDIELLAIK
jgi:FKBP-type peptidyl-prolyl cis-trans isomerase